jgi:cytochrome oxidase Cu insertion factor (SCO1/SenC/PrrC family)
MRYAVLVLLLSLLVVGCAETIVDTETEPVEEPETKTTEEVIDNPPQEVQPTEIDPPQATTTTTWMTEVLTDVNSKETFAIAQFKGTPILLESFAVWCPRCTSQQKNIQALHEEVGDEVISISLNTDPNEDAARVQDHTARHGFTGRYAIAPKELTQALIDEFGISVVNAPSVPVVLVCEDLSTRLLPRGIKSANTLKNEIAKGC